MSLLRGLAVTIDLACVRSALNALILFYFLLGNDTYSRSALFLGQNDIDARQPQLILIHQVLIGILRRIPDIRLDRVCPVRMPNSRRIGNQCGQQHHQQ